LGERKKKMENNSLRTKVKRKEAPLLQHAQRHLARKIATAFFSIILFGFLYSGCSQAKEAEQNKELRVQKEEVKQPKEGKKDDSSVLQPSPFTEEKQKLLDKIDDNILKAPTAYFDSQEGAAPYLRILLKGDHRNIRLYRGYEALSEDCRKQDYDEAMSKAVTVLDPKTKAGLQLLIEVLKTKREYPVSLAQAANAVNRSQNNSVIPLLREVVKNPSLEVRYAAGNSLLVLGDVDTALPVLDELTKEGVANALYTVYHNMQGKKWERRGIESIRKALTYDNNESKARAVLYSIRLTKRGAIKEDLSKLENIFIKISQDILNKKA
jgi:TPP-dependent indolepyruvate ferredoxin oxidoreductase alpha subunit